MVSEIAVLKLRVAAQCCKNSASVNCSTRNPVVWFCCSIRLHVSVDDLGLGGIPGGRYVGTEIGHGPVPVTDTHFRPTFDDTVVGAAKSGTTVDLPLRGIHAN